MAAVTITENCELVIPQKLRKSLGLRPGAKVHIFEYNGRLEIVPVRKLKEMRGFLKGIDTSVPRDKDRV